MVAYGVAILCVLSLTVGQILLKIGATAMAESDSFFAIKPAAIFFAVMCLYGVTAVAWFWVLQKAELGRIYPLTALAFILVPLGSYFVLGERFQPQYFVGVVMILAGIVIVLKA